MQDNSPLEGVVKHWRSNSDIMGIIAPVRDNTPFRRLLAQVCHGSVSTVPTSRSPPPSHPGISVAKPRTPISITSKTSSCFTKNATPDRWERQKSAPRPPMAYRSAIAISPGAIALKCRSKTATSQ
ncbi:hypothetical protein SPLC1_S050670 [Arthrospira platensis C1]|nr:hypothetical protein SPLC1_S050670 [Arthrospira platensis C1]